MSRRELSQYCRFISGSDIIITGNDMRFYTILGLLFLSCLPSTVESTNCSGVDYGGWCFTLSPDVLTWSAATQYCSDNGLQQAQIKDEGTRNALSNHFSANADVDAWLFVQESEVEDWHWIADQFPIDMQGCYHDDAWEHDLPEEVHLGYITIDKCKDGCIALGANYTYAATQFTECYCGNSYGRYGMDTSATPCEVSCRGNNDQYCGGWESNYIHRLDVPEGTFSEWGYRQPRNEDGNEKCGAFGYVSGDIPMRPFHDEQCSRLYRSVCRLETDPCPVEKTSDEMMITNDTYDNMTDCIAVFTTLRNWFDARTTCQLNGGDLVTIYNASYQAYIERVLKDHSMNKHWMGLVRTEWTYYEDGSDIGFFDWNDNEPDGWNERCVIMPTSTLKWQDVDCNTTEARALCQNTSDTTTTSATTSTETTSTTTETTQTEDSGTGTTTTTMTTETPTAESEASSTTPTATTSASTGSTSTGTLTATTSTSGATTMTTGTTTSDEQEATTTTSGGSASTSTMTSSTGTTAGATTTSNDDQGDNGQGDNGQGDNGQGDNGQGDNDQGDNGQGDNDQGNNDQGQNDVDAAASTSEDSGWTSFQIFILVAVIILIIAIIIAVVVYFVVKKKNNDSRVGPDDDSVNGNVGSDNPYTTLNEDNSHTGLVSSKPGEKY